MNLKKFLKMSLIIGITFSLNACYKSPDTALNSQLDLGLYQGMHISFIKDQSSSNSKGFYVIDNSTYNPNGLSNTDFGKEKLIGHYGDLNVFFISDHTSSDGKGFYLFKTPSGNLVPNVNFSTSYSSGKSTTNYNVATIFTSDININTKIVKKEDTTINVNELSPSELKQLAQELLNLSENKTYIQTNKLKY